MRLIVTRPAEDAGPLRDKLAALGHTVTIVPLLRIVPRPGVTIPRRSYQAVAATSANAIRVLTDHAHLKSLPMLTVGPQSLAAARLAGFTRCEARGGDVDGLARYIGDKLDPSQGPLLYLSGAETSGDLEARLTQLGFAVERVILYDAEAAASLPAFALEEHDGVLLYSPRSARIWALQARDLPAAACLHHFCLSENVAAVLPTAWPRSIAATADEASMLALLDRSAGTR